MKTADGGFLLEGRFDFQTLTSPYQAEEMAEVIFLVIVAICIIALFAIEGNRAKQLEKLENRIEFLQDRLLELATRNDIQEALLKLKANDPDRKLLKVTNKETGNVKLRVVTKDGKEIKDLKISS